MAEDKKIRYGRTFKKGEVIYNIGENASCAFLIESGEVEFPSEKGETLIPTAQEGEIFGEMALIDDSLRTTKAVAVEETVCCMISKEQINDRINDADPIVRLLIATYINRLRSRLKQSFTNEDRTSITNIKSFGQGLFNRSSIHTDHQVIEKILLERDLKETLSNGNLSMHYQPIIDLNTQEIVGLESLIRSKSLPSHIGPDTFMGVAEETSLIVPFGQWVVKKSCHDFAKLKKDIQKQTGKNLDIFLSINISGRQLVDPDFFDILQKATWSNKLKSKDIKIELTERILVSQNVVFKWIEKIRKLGYSVAVDDFGTGFANFENLCNININNLKIDKSFVKNIDSNKNMQIVTSSLIRMAQGLGLKVVAEGIETKNEYKTILKMGCDYGQGYLFSKPMEINEILSRLISERSSKKKKSAA